MDLIVEGPSDNRSTSSINHDKWVALEERLKAIEGNNMIDLRSLSLFGSKSYGVEGVQSAGLHQVRMPEHPSPVILQQVG